MFHPEQTLQQTAEAIVTKLDAIGRNYNSLDYGLPVESEYSFKTMVNAVKHILTESGAEWRDGEAESRMNHLAESLLQVREHRAQLEREVERLKGEADRLREELEELEEKLEQKTASASMWSKKAMEAGLERNQLSAEVERLKGEADRQWISVNDRLPDVIGILAYTGGLILKLTVLDGIYYTPEGDKWCNEVTHWMKLPEPPKPSGHE